MHRRAVVSFLGSAAPWYHPAITQAFSQSRTPTGSVALAFLASLAFPTALIALALEQVFVQVLGRRAQARSTTSRRDQRIQF
jgi:hypothetical protein